MHLCSECRRRLPFFILYILFLAALLGYGIGLISEWNLLLIAVVFVASMVFGVLHVYCCSSRLCRFFCHDKTSSAPTHGTPKVT